MKRKDPLQETLGDTIRKKCEGTDKTVLVLYLPTSDCPARRNRVISSSLAASHSSCDTGEKSPALLKPSKWTLLPQKLCKTSSGSPHSSVTILGPTHLLHVPHACWCLAHASLVYFHLLTSWADWALFDFVVVAVPGVYEIPTNPPLVFFANSDRIETLRPLVPAKD